MPLAGPGLRGPTSTSSQLRPRTGRYSTNSSQQRMRVLFLDFRFSNYRKFRKPTLDFDMLTCTKYSVLAEPFKRNEKPAKQNFVKSQDLIP